MDTVLNACSSVTDTRQPLGHLKGNSVLLMLSRAHRVQQVCKLPRHVLSDACSYASMLRPQSAADVPS